MIIEIKKFLYWSGFDAADQFAHGYIFTLDTDAANNYLAKQNITVQQFKIRWRIVRSTTLKPQVTITFYRQLSALLRAGVSLTQAISTLASTHDAHFQKILLSMRMHIEIGNSFYISLQQNPGYFDNFSCQLIHIAENTGTLDTMLDQIAILHEKKKALADTVKQALLYPTVILLAAVIVTLIMLVLVVPQFASIFADFNAPLPAMTLVVIRISHFIRDDYWLSYLPLFMLYLLRYYYQQSARCKLLLQNYLYSLPVLHNLLQRYFSAKFAHTLALMMHAGIPILSAMTLIEKICFSQKSKIDMKNLQNKIAQGSAIHTAMQDSSLFTPLMLQMVKVGEESGMLATMLQHVAHLHEAELQHLTKQMTQLLEPLIITMLGVLIGGLVISMYLPIFKLGTVM